MLSFIILLCLRSSVRQAYADSSTGILLLHYQLFLVVWALGLAMHALRAQGGTTPPMHGCPTTSPSGCSEPASHPSLWCPATAQHCQFYLNH